MTSSFNNPGNDQGASDILRLEVLDILRGAVWSGPGRSLDLAGQLRPPHSILTIIDSGMSLSWHRLAQPLQPASGPPSHLRRADFLRSQTWSSLDLALPPRCAVRQLRLEWLAIDAVHSRLSDDGSPVYPIIRLSSARCIEMRKARAYDSLFC